MRIALGFVLALWTSILLAACTGPVSVTNSDDSPKVTISFGTGVQAKPTPEQMLAREIEELRSLSTKVSWYGNSSNLFDELGRHAEEVIPELKELSQKPLLPAIDRLGRIRNQDTAPFLVAQLRPCEGQSQCYEWNERVREAIARTGATSAAVHLFNQPDSIEELAYLMPDDAEGVLVAAFISRKHGELEILLDNVADLLERWPHRFPEIRSSSTLVEEVRTGVIDKNTRRDRKAILNAMRVLVLQDSVESKKAIIDLLNRASGSLRWAFRPIAAAQPSGYEQAAFNRLDQASRVSWSQERLDETLSNIRLEEAAEAWIEVLGQYSPFGVPLKKLDELDPERAANTAHAIFQSENNERRDDLYRELTWNIKYSTNMGRMLARLLIKHELDNVATSTSKEQREEEILGTIARSFGAASLLPWLAYRAAAAGEEAELAIPFRTAVLDLALADPSDWTWMEEHEAYQIRAAYRIAQSMKAGADGNAALVAEIRALEEEERTSAAHALQYLRPYPIDILIDFLEDDVEGVSGLATFSLLQVASQDHELHEKLRRRYVPDIIRTCNMSHQKNQLVSLLDETSILHLIDRLAAELEKDFSFGVAEILDLLARLTGQNYGYDIDAWRSWYSSQRGVSTET